MNNEKKIQSIARRTIEIESAAISNLLDSIDDEFNVCINALFQTEGDIIITGIGKSAIIAKKIVATFNSTGTPSKFLHAADAIHGDLGMIKSKDIVLCISKSGETPEIKVLVPFLKNLGNKIIGMVANKSSFLANQADFVIHTPISVEADPNNLAPTTSTTVQMVMGDAMATVLLALRGFDQKDFAQFHPGGALGKQLYLRVKDLYPKNEKPQVLVTTTIKDTIIEISSKRLGVAVVVDEQQQVKGIVTDGDLRRMLEKTNEINNLLAKDIMSATPKTIEADQLAVKALSILQKNSISQIVVVENKKYLGVIHLHDLIREGLI